MRTAYKCRAYPDPEQAHVLNRTFGCIRVAWNQTLAWRQQRYDADKTGTTYAQASAHLTAIKATDELAWLNEVSSVPLQQAIRHQQMAYTAFFAKRARYPRFKSRNGRQSAEYTRSGFLWRDGHLYLAKMGTPLVFTWSWPGIDPATIDPSTVTVCRDPCGRWYVSLAVEVPGPDPLPATGQAIGVDLGIKDSAVTSDRAKARAKAARAHRKVRAARADCLHKTSTRLVRDHDLISLEDLAVKNMVRNRKVAKAIADCGWRTFREMLEYKAARYGRQVIVIDR
jgi:putative transposase